MSNLKIGPVDITAGTAKLDVGGLQVGTNQVVTNTDGSITLIGGVHTFNTSGHTISSQQSALLAVGGGSGYSKEVIFKTGNNTRWSMGSNGGSESGNNSGSNFYLSRCTDAGGFIDSPITIDRSTGVVSLNTSVTVPSLDVAANDSRAASSGFVKSCLANIDDRTAGDSSSYAANTRFVTTALANASGSKVTTFNGRSGTVTLSAADVIDALGYTPVNPANAVTGIRKLTPGRWNLGTWIPESYSAPKTGVVTFAGYIEDMGTYLAITGDGNDGAPTPSGFCVHPQSLVTMNDDSIKFAQDIRPGDILQGNNKVLGILNSTLSTRSWVEVNGKAVVTSDHLVKLEEGWAVRSREQYRENYLGKVFACKTLSGMKKITSDFGDPDTFPELEIGLTLSTGETITSIKEFINARNHPVIALYTEQNSFFADGVEVASMGREVEAE